MTGQSYMQKKSNTNFLALKNGQNAHIIRVCVLFLFHVSCILMKMMAFKSIKRFGTLILIVFSGVLVLSSCAPKYGCPINEETHVDFDKTKGKRGKSQLFDKKTSRRIKGR